MTDDKYGELTYIHRSENFYKVEKNGKFGIVFKKRDQKAKEIIPIIYDQVTYVGRFHWKPAFGIILNNKYGILSSDGKVLVPPLFYHVSDISEFGRSRKGTENSIHITLIGIGSARIKNINENLNKKLIVGVFNLKQ